MKKESKGFIAGMVATTLLASATSVIAKNQSEMVEVFYKNIKLNINGVEYTPTDAKGNTVEPFIYNGTTYLPVRSVSEALNKEVVWENDTRTIFIDDVASVTTEEPKEEEITEEVTDYSGTYVGYSWKGESKGTTLDEAGQKIETKLTLSEDGTITAVEFDFLKKSGEEWIKRDDSTAEVTTDFSVEPTVATLGAEKANGASMFDITTNDKMSLYVVDVDENGTVAYGIVDPLTRYLFEAKFDADFDYSTTFGELNINDGLTPTVLTSGSGSIKPKNWEELNGKNLLDLSIYSHVLNLRGDYKGLTKETTIKELLEMSGVEFVDGVPTKPEVNYGFHSNGGWEGNYEAMAEYLVGKNATEITGLADFSKRSYKGNEYVYSINNDGFFGINSDTVTGATKSIQDSYDTLSGATVRLSRENTSYQRALVEAGILTEDDVIKGRF